MLEIMVFENLSELIVEFGYCVVGYIWRLKFLGGVFSRMYIICVILFCEFFYRYFINSKW